MTPVFFKGAAFLFLKSDYCSMYPVGNTIKIIYIDKNRNRDQ